MLRPNLGSRTAEKTEQNNYLPGRRQSVEQDVHKYGNDFVPQAKTADTGPSEKCVISWRVRQAA